MRHPGRGPGGPALCLNQIRIARPRVSRRAERELQCRPSCPSAPISARPPAPPRTARTGGSASGTAARVSRVSGRTGAISTAATKGTSARACGVQPAGARVADADRQGALARHGVGRDVAQVVDHQQRAGEQPDRDAGGKGEPGQAADLHERGADHRGNPEEGEHRHLTETAVAVGVAAAGVGPTRRPRRPRPTASSQHEVATASTRPARQATPKLARAALRTWRGAASPAATSRTRPTRASSVPRMPSL